MRRFIVLLACLGMLTAARAADGDEERSGSREVCLSQAEARQAVTQKTVIAPAVAMRAARSFAAGGRIIRASLCRTDDQLAYHITTLEKDGRVIRVTVDGRSGKVEPYR